MGFGGLGSLSTSRMLLIALLAAVGWRETIALPSCTSTETCTADEVMIMGTCVTTKVDDDTGKDYAVCVRNSASKVRAIWYYPRNNDECTLNACYCYCTSVGYYFTAFLPTATITARIGNRFGQKVQKVGRCWCHNEVSKALKKTEQHPKEMSTCDSKDVVLLFNGYNKKKRAEAAIYKCNGATPDRTGLQSRSAAITAPTCDRNVKICWNIGYSEISKLKREAGVSFAQCACDCFGNKYGESFKFALYQEIHKKCVCSNKSAVKIQTKGFEWKVSRKKRPCPNTYFTQMSRTEKKHTDCCNLDKRPVGPPPGPPPAPTTKATTTTTPASSSSRSKGLFGLPPGLGGKKPTTTTTTTPASSSSRSSGLFGGPPGFPLGGTQPPTNTVDFYDPGFMVPPLDPFTINFVYNDPPLPEMPIIFAGPEMPDFDFDLGEPTLPEFEFTFSPPEIMYITFPVQPWDPLIGNGPIVVDDFGLPAMEPWIPPEWGTPEEWGPFNEVPMWPTDWQQPWPSVWEPLPAFSALDPDMPFLFEFF